MLSRRIATALSRRPSRPLPQLRQLPLVQQRTFLPPTHAQTRDVLDEQYPDYPEYTDKEDPGMNGGYVNPPFVKRQFRDPHADWWDKQERRNFGEPVHEDNDLLGIFSTYEYTHMKPSQGLVGWAAFLSFIVGTYFFVKATLPDQPSYPKEYEGGLERELGGPGAERARAPGDPDPEV